MLGGFIMFFSALPRLFGNPEPFPGSVLGCPKIGNEGI
jgi:hypothetical protein